MNGFQIHARTRAVAPDLAERFRRIPVANISDCMSRMTAGGPRLRPMHGGAVMAGPALTVRTRPGDNLLVHKALDLAQPGDVIVVDAGGDLTNAIIGEIMTSYAARAAWRASSSTARSATAARSGRAISVYAAGVTHRGPYKDGPGEINGTIALDGMTIAPGDLILGDDDGVLAIPFDQVETLYQAAQAKHEIEERMLADIAAGTLDTRGSTRASGSSAARGLTMTAPARHAFTVARLDLWIDPVFDAAIQDDAALRLSVLAAAAGDARTAEGLAQARAYHVSAARDEVPRGWQVTPDLLAACPRLLCVSSGGAGYDTIDVAACTQAGVAVVNQAGANAASVAEMTYALLLSLVKRLDESGAALRAGTARSREALMGREIEGRAIGLVGIGEIGRRVARIAQGFGLTVIACDPLLTAEEIRARAEPVDFDTLLARADILSLHCPLDEATRGLMDAWAFARMKPGALFLSTARGGIHDEDALLAALDSGHLAGAGLDVWRVEPPSPASRLLQHPNVASAFHTGGVTHEGRRKVAAGSARQISQMLAGVRPERLLNPYVWPRFLERLAQARAD